MAGPLITQRTRSNLLRVLLSQALSREPEAAEHE